MDTTERVSLESDHILHILPSDFTVENLKVDQKKLIEYGTLLRNQGKDVLLLANASEVPKLVRSDARKQSLLNIKSLDPKRSAVYGASRYVGYMANWVIKAMGRGEQIKLFATKEEALAWLLGKRAAHKGEENGRQTE